MDINGAQWSLSGAEAILRLCPLQTSDDFDMIIGVFTNTKNFIGGQAGH